MRVRVAAGVIVVALVAAACGGSDDDAAGDKAPPTSGAGPVDAITIVRDAVIATRDAGRARTVSTFYFDAGPFGTTDIAEGLIDLATGDAEFDVDMSDKPSSLVPEGTPPSEIHMTAIEHDGALYLRFPAGFSATGHGDEWIEIPADADPVAPLVPDGMDGTSGRIWLAARLLRPAHCLDVLDQAVSAREVGPDSVRGKPTTRYTVDYHPRAWVEGTGLFMFFGKDRSPERLAVLDDVIDSAATIDVWIDELGRVRKLVGTGDLSIVAPFFDPPSDPAAWRSLRSECELFELGVDDQPAAIPTEGVFEPGG